MTLVGMQELRQPEEALLHGSCIGRILHLHSNRSVDLGLEQAQMLPSSDKNVPMRTPTSQPQFHARPMGSIPQRRQSFQHDNAYRETIRRDGSAPPEFDRPWERRRCAPRRPLALGRLLADCAAQRCAWHLPSLALPPSQSAARALSAIYLQFQVMLVSPASPLWYCGSLYR